ncbi:hypothetical protein GCM10009786_16320 [Leucobacter alluvii]|uniref:Uncharacterized protein n=1 Tax=Leucobacter alluvii TaxID=340321 RepID=A0ABP5N287_9MICO
MDRVGVLPGLGLEAIDRKRVERAEGKRVAIDDHEGRLSVRHVPSLQSAADIPQDGRRRPRLARVIDTTKGTDVRSSQRSNFLP